jgi:sugar transferase EpsL
MHLPEPRRCLDAVVAGALGLVSAPVVGVLALFVRRNLGPPAFIRQERAGLRGRPFVLVKLRTMSDEVSPTGNLLPDADRLTPFGRWLRETSLDELPELWNVVKGDMALVGPRPLPVRYLNRYTSQEIRRLDVRPGLTGWAQVNGRNLTSWEERLEMDTWYVDHRTLRLDLAILARTTWAVLARKGIAAEGHATMPEFRPESESE